MASTEEILKKVKKEFGDSVAVRGSSTFVDTVRIPSGIFPLDLATGGGFPMGRVSVVYGPESSNKTNVVLKTIAQAQRKFKNKKCVFVDVEHAYDPKWARKLGVDTEELILLTPDFAEQAVDMIEAFLYASDVSLVALDSVAALTTENEVESSAGKMIVGGASLLTGKLFKKTTVSFNRMRNQGHMPPAFIAINQIRNKIGVMYGDPETMPGGNAVKFASSMTVRLYGKNILDKKVDPVMPAFKETNIILKKWKVPILAASAKFMMQMLDFGGRPAGTVEDWNTVSNYLKDLDYLGKAEKGGWDMFGELYKTLDECKKTLYSDPEMLDEARSTIISELLAKGTIGAQEDSEEDAEEVAEL